MKSETLSSCFNEELPSANNSNIIVVVPFYNEANNIVSFMETINSGLQETNSIYMLGVNHRSNDSSEDLFYKHGLGTVGIVREDAQVASVGIPRQKGLNIAVKLAEQQAMNNRKIIVGSIDIDSKVSKGFINEVMSFLNSDKDFLVFPTRYDQSYFINCINQQINSNAKSACTKALIGVDWLKFKLRHELLSAGAIETRGSGGYFFTVEGYHKAGGHKAVYSRDHTIITGESNAIGIRAKRNNATYHYGESISIANPRRMLRSITKKHDDYQISNAGKIFETTKNIESLPILCHTEWMDYFNRSIYGALRTYTIKGLAYGICEKLVQNVQLKHLEELINSASKIKENADFKSDELDAIGSSPYLEIFKIAFEKLGNNKQQELMQSICNYLPNEVDLITWANSSEEKLGNK